MIWGDAFGTNLGRICRAFRVSYNSLTFLLSFVGPTAADVDRKAIG